MIPSLFPIFVQHESKLLDGTEVPASKFCRDGIVNRGECKKHYETLHSLPYGYYQCPYGFTSKSFSFDQRKLVITGVIAYPRFETPNERKMAKDFPSTKVTRKSIDQFVGFLGELEKLRADTIEKASKVLPQAFHELRKLNGAVIQHAEREINDRGDSRSLLSIKAAAELMRNNFDILEALSNIEGIKALPNDSTINLFDLVFKMKRVLQERTKEKNMSINVTGEGDKPLVVGSQKSFPIVPAVLLENAIKYGANGSLIRAEIAYSGKLATLVVENQSVENIDPVTCFDRGVRFTDKVEGGGFGLFLAKEVVLCHNGKIRCESANGMVRMIVELPLHKVISHVS